MNDPMAYLLGLAAFTGVVHTILGPDHYIPFIALSRSGQWSAVRTVAIVSACGVAHVLASVLLGVAGIALGWSVGGLDAFTSWRVDLSAWLLIGFGLAYAIWGTRRAILRGPHGHLHLHEDGTVHRHHGGNNSRHVHTDGSSDAGSGSRTTAWVLFTIFIFGPCEPLIPQLMYPAAERNLWGVALVTLVFGVSTIGTMLAAVAVGRYGTSFVPGDAWTRYGHAISGSALVMCGLAIKLGL